MILKRRGHEASYSRARTHIWTNLTYHRILNNGSRRCRIDNITIDYTCSPNTYRKYSPQTHWTETSEIEMTEMTEMLKQLTKGKPDENQT